ncbi:MAG: hypothetical protein O9267_05585 [Flavobacterium sp.]|uniref:hypothetical protein n=1 Tax=Flavobacterium sp. TaxID=239 RepID=UPI0022BC2006|nr:hypothetical protein [Flavobacterium sp.]MCZ8197056.1 hypothetical protein [Flavobacterium sp.]
MSRKILFQTLKDKNPQEVINSGPFECKSDDAWLGYGFYFWDTFEYLSHWWGKVKMKNNYIVCKAKCDFNTKECFDLVGEPEHMDLFGSIIDLMRSEGLIDDETTTVSDIFYYLKYTLDIFDYSSSRAVGVNSISPDKSPEYTYRMILEPNNKKQFIDYRPAIQICLYDKKALNLSEYEIVYPDKYVQK